LVRDLARKTIMVVALLRFFPAPMIILAAQVRKEERGPFPSLRLPIIYARLANVLDHK